MTRKKKMSHTTTHKNTTMTHSQPTVGIVGAGPAGLFSAWTLLSQDPFVRVHIFEKEKYSGGRTRMSRVDHVSVVTGAGVIRDADCLLKNLVSTVGVTLSPFFTRIQKKYRHEQDVLNMVRMMTHPSVVKKYRRDETFQQNITRVFGRDVLTRFIENTGYTDYLDADILDTLFEYGFQDNTPHQKMYGVNWNLLINRLTRRLQHEYGRRVTFVYRTPITHVENIEHMVRGNIILNHVYTVNLLIWTAPRPSWSVLTPLFSTASPMVQKKWDDVLRGVQCQPFLRLYGIPTRRDYSKASRMYPYMTFMPHDNPIQKITPYKKNVYMISYSDNQNAEKTYTSDPSLLYRHTGIHWTQTRPFYHQCGTHFFTPLGQITSFRSRRAFLRFAQHPLPDVFLCSEGLSHNQGWTEGALESVQTITPLVLKTLKRYSSQTKKKM